MAMTLPQFLLILRARSTLVLSTLFATVVVVLVVSLLLPKQYTANAAVVVDVKSPDPIGGLILPGMISPGYMATQVDIITSDRVAQRVVKLLRLDESPQFKAQWQDATEGQGNITIWLANLLHGKLEVKPSHESNVINIGYRGADPAFTAEVANAFAQAYIDANLEIKVEPARQSAGWFEEQTKFQRGQLEAAQSALSRYQQETGIVATDDSIDYETAKLNELSTQLTVIQGETSDSHSKSTSAGSGTLAEVIQNPLITTLKTDVARLEAKLQESNINLGKNHPQTQRSESELASLKARLASEIHKINSSFNTSYQVGRQKEKDLVAAMAVQKSRILDLNKQRDEISVLKRDVESAQRDFEGVSLRSAQTRLESRSIQTNVVLLSPAFEPTRYSQPRIFLNLLVSLLLGVMLGVAAALMLELSNRRVRSADDLAEAGGRPVLSSIPSVKPAPTWRQWLRINHAGSQTNTVAADS